ncbi:ATP-binding protein [Rhodobacteraceae bacterium N5(2021)]|uniref:ATP-binding protein n=1 Tax=Gymnodinialimonas phycosphaerae TaxID=2841589 RepID=A0A975TTU2_9RHOB|nr:ATP-binding protein [Gymnodinialimonas phycosphaerae]MBY4893970.1 ATP-binding protein [Gymnodinialimonas phycosphaerae]
MPPTTAPDFFHRFTSGTTQVRCTLDQARVALQAARIDDATCDTSQIILGEVLNNVVEHAYRCEEGHPIELSIWFDDTGLWCNVHDQGAPMPGGVPPEGRGACIDASDRDGLPEGGFGWAMVHALTQDLQYLRVDGCNDLAFLISASHP